MKNYLKLTSVLLATVLMVTSCKKDETEEETTENTTNETGDTESPSNYISVNDGPSITLSRSELEDDYVWVAGAEGFAIDLRLISDDVTWSSFVPSASGGSTSNKAYVLFEMYSPSQNALAEGTYSNGTFDAYEEFTFVDAHLKLFDSDAIYHEYDFESNPDNEIVVTVSGSKYNVDFTFYSGTDKIVGNYNGDLGNYD